jgi:hypothetical protein
MKSGENGMMEYWNNGKKKRNDGMMGKKSMKETSSVEFVFSSFHIPTFQYS